MFRPRRWAALLAGLSFGLLPVTLLPGVVPAAHADCYETATASDKKGNKWVEDTCTRTDGIGTMYYMYYVRRTGPMGFCSEKIDPEQVDVSSYQSKCKFPKELRVARPNGTKSKPEVGEGLPNGCPQTGCPPDWNPPTVVSSPPEPPPANPPRRFNG